MIKVHTSYTSATGISPCVWRSWFRLAGSVHYLHTVTKPNKRQISRWRKRVYKAYPLAVAHDKTFIAPDSDFI